MANQRNYEVMCFLEHEGKCHVTMDVVKGDLLINVLRGSPMIEKKQLFLWIQQLSAQIEKYHRCKRNQCYRFLNVYSVVVTDTEAYLLDLEAEGNAFVAKYMQRQEIRNGFSHPKAQMRATTKMAIDVYGFGKTIQYLLAHCQVVPNLNRKDEHLLMKVIQKSIELNSKKQYQNFKQIRNDLSKLKSNKLSKIGKKSRMIVLAFIVGTAVFCTFFQVGKHVFRADKGGKAEKIVKNDLTENQSEKKVQQDKEQVITDNENIESEQTAQFANDEESAIQEPAANQEDSFIDEHVDVMQLLQEDSQKNTSAANKEMIQLGEETHMEVLQYLATAYDREEMYEKAISVYGELCHMNLQKELLEQVYKRRAELQRKEQQYDAALSTVKEGMTNELLGESSALQLLYLRLICESPDLGKEQKEQDCTSLWGKCSEELKESEEFKKLLSEFQITEEGGKVWIGKE